METAIATPISRAEAVMGQRVRVALDDGREVTGELTEWTPGYLRANTAPKSWWNVPTYSVRAVYAM